MDEWFERSFDETYLALYARRDLREAEANLRDLIGLVDPPRHLPVLDLGCGAGRYLCALAAMGFSHLVGLDLSNPLLACARDTVTGAVGAAACEVALVRADMRHIPFVGCFGTALSLFTSFGYFQAEAENLVVLQGVYTALLPGGVLALDVMHRPRVLATLVSRDDDRRGGWHIVSERRITPDGLRVEKRTIVEREDSAPRVYTESVRLYGTAELKGMLAHAGFALVRAYGSFAGAPLTDTSARLLLVATKDRTGA